MSEQKYAACNPWHGCTKYSEGCRYCYVYRQDEAYGSPVSSEQCRKTQNFYLPVKKKRDGSFKIEPGSIVMTCFTSDFLLKDGDEWRRECWEMIKSRSDCMFYFFTKRIERFMECVPADWGEGYKNVIVGCTCENQDRAEFRLPIFTELPIKHKTVIIGPMLGPIELEKYLNGSICEAACSGESGLNVRPLDYDWVLDVRRQCMNKGVPFQFHQTGAYFIKNGRMYRVPRRFQTLQARKAGIDYKIADGYMATPGAAKTINEWISCGHEVSIITGRPSGVYEPSRIWLDEHGLKNARLYCLNKYGRDYFIKNSNSTLELEDYYRMKFDYAVEDSPKAFRFFEHLPELKVLVFDRPWNRECAFPNGNYQRCADWESIRRIAAGE